MTMHRPETGSLDDVRKRRRELHAVLVEVERAIARPAPGRTDEWLAFVGDHLDRLRDSFEEHVHGTENDDGLFARIVSAAPRLSVAVRQLADEHDEIQDGIREAA